MPTLTFKKLPQEKKERILKALIKEFSRVPFNEASIAKIIIDADIPRGSFYQYFKDKEDAFFYILEFHSTDIKKYLLNVLIKNKGEMIKSFIELYKYILEKITKEENEVYFKNIFLNMNFAVEKMFSLNLEDNLNAVINLINIDNINISSKLQLIYIIDIIEAIMFRNLIQSYKRSVSKEKNIEIFLKEISFLEKGIYKK
ncbi:MAG: TetR family transcriptional regulator [Bacilli bacterium]|jgi:AcrR family transcriptional regulator